MNIEPEARATRAAPEGTRLCSEELRASGAQGIIDHELRRGTIKIRVRLTDSSVSPSRRAAAFGGKLWYVSARALQKCWGLDPRCVGGHLVRRSGLPARVAQHGG